MCECECTRVCCVSECTRVSVCVGVRERVCVCECVSVNACIRTHYTTNRQYTYAFRQYDTSGTKWKAKAFPTSFLPLCTARGVV